ncbi:S41 family peptidase [Pantoea sp. Tr-811]|uniref:S41 family peptidase n=1 Tax=Pantoea sp. Tr-811 TaxID=2608361 RepID=UPI00141E1C60|nr:S41 family peptidase [Pantoea sp. Tr-811]
MMNDFISLSEKMLFSAQVYSAIISYFAHWEGLCRQDFDLHFKKHLEESLSTASRLSYAQSLMRLAAKLNNSHTFFFDPWVQENFGMNLGFSLQKIDDKWIVVDSQRLELPPGSIVNTIDEKPVGEFYGDLAQFISASDEISRATRFTTHAYLWPKKFSLTFDDDQKIIIDRSLAPTERLSHMPSEQASPFYHKVSSFSKPEHELNAIDFFSNNAGVPSVILDLRGNGGGTTPVRLIGSLMAEWYWPKIAERDHKSGKEAELSSAVVTNDQNLLRLFDAQRVALKFKKSIQKKSRPIFTGRLIVLIDRGCASACENLLLALKQRPSTLFVGERTFGSSGQPYIVSSTCTMYFAVGARKIYMDDINSLEGRGISPDFNIPLTPESLRSRHDQALEFACQLLNLN